MSQTTIESTTNECIEGHFSSWDGEQLFYRAWLPDASADSVDRAVVLVHRGHEHSGRLQDLVDGIVGSPPCDYAAFAWDLRGHGRSPGARGWASDVATLVRDLDAFVAFIGDKFGFEQEQLAVIANSFGAVIAAAWAHDYAPRIRAMILAAPAFRIKLYVPLAVPLLRLAQKFKKRMFIKSYVRPKMLTHDPAQAQAYSDDPLITRDVAVHLLLDLHDTATRIVNDACAINIPTMVLAAEKDWVVQTRPQRAFVDRLRAGLKEFKVYGGFHHAVFHELDRHQAYKDSCDFLTAAFDHHTPKLPPAGTAFSWAEYTRHQQPASWWRRLYFESTKLSMRTAGRLSRGISIGLDSGFNSGETLDYVYENEARGTAFIGRLIDRGYLDSTGWKGIRVRRSYLQTLLAEAIAAKISQHGHARILDIAAGHGRYVLQTVSSVDDDRVSVELRDMSAAHLEAARARAEGLGIRNLTTTVADAFDPSATGELCPPDIVIVSGLYELFPDNELVRTSLASIARILPPGGTLIYTGQPWHPQMELIARTLTGFDNTPWIMRRRTQAELDSLVCDAGFTRTNLLVGPQGIFTVAAATREET